MEKEQFLHFLQDNILTIFTGSEIFGEEQSGDRDTMVAMGPGGTILVKFKRTDDYRFVIKRIQPFKNFEVSLIRNILCEVRKINALNVEPEYFHKFHQYATEKAICNAVASSNGKVLFEIIDQMSNWGSRTYEGSNCKLGFLFTNRKAPKNVNKNLSIVEILHQDFSAVLSDGINTCIEVSGDGYLMSYLPIPKVRDQKLYCPYAYLKIASMASGQKVGVSLQENGDILIFKEKSLVFAKRRGKWMCFSHEEIINRITERTSDAVEEIRRAIYLSALDASFAQTGACIVHLTKDNENGFLRHINKYDILMEDYYKEKVDEELSQSFFFGIKEDQTPKPYEDFQKEERCIKIASLKKIIGARKFHELDRKLRQELLAIDGATVIDDDGSVVAIGAIIQIEAGSTGGGRLAATKTLSKYGTAIKISADGAIEGYRMDKQKLRSKPIFMI